MSWYPISARVFQPFVKVWTPRTPDSSYDSFGVYPPPPRRVMTPLIAESMGTGLTLEAASYWANQVPVGSAEHVGTGVIVLSGTYTP